MADTATVEWVGPNGTTINLTDLAGAGYLIENGTDGELFGAAASDIVADAAQEGSTVRGTYTPPRIGTMAVYVEGATEQQFRDRWRTLVSAFTSTKRSGPGWLRVTWPDGTAREIAALFDDGLKNSGAVRSQLSSVTLYCPDPYWRDTVPVPLSRMQSTSADFLAPYPSVSPSNTLGDTILTNPGDTDAYINWLISGPASSVIATRNDTGDSWTLDIAGKTSHGPLAVGEQATVWTDPPQVRGPTGEVWTAALNWPQAELWALPPGDTSVTFQIIGAAVGSEISATFYVRRDTA